MDDLAAVAADGRHDRGRAAAGALVAEPFVAQVRHEDAVLHVTVDGVGATRAWHLEEVPRAARDLVVAVLGLPATAVEIVVALHPSAGPRPVPLPG